jgi:large subunit ribosomal protein L15
MTRLLPKIVGKKKKRVGRGYGSGKGGHTTGRGQKGQKSRSKIGILFEGVKVKKSLLRRLPQLRGKDRFKARPRPLTLNLSDLAKLPVGSKVNIENLIKYGLVDERKAKKYGVKILGDGAIEKNLTFLVPVSASAAKKIEKAGGKIEKGKDIT